MTNSPCYDTETKTDCPKRHVGCKIDCPQWKVWLVQHEKEREQIRSNRAAERAADSFLIEQGERIRKDTLRKSEFRNRRRKA